MHALIVCACNVQKESTKVWMGVLWVSVFKVVRDISITLLKGLVIENEGKRHPPLQLKAKGTSIGTLHAN